jgi:hypothetical protein
MIGDGGCYVDSQGFVKEIPHPNEVIDIYLDQVKRHKEADLTDGAMSPAVIKKKRSDPKGLSKMKPIVIDKIKDRLSKSDSKIVQNGCWLCDGWKELKFEWNDCKFLYLLPFLKCSDKPIKETNKTILFIFTWNSMVSSLT